MNRDRTPPAARGKRLILRFAMAAVVLALAFSAFQYYQTGRLNWYKTPLLAVGDAFTGLTEPAPALDGDTVEGLTMTGLVSSVTDGDTLVLRSPLWKSHTVRLYGIDTPEWNQAYGSIASAALKEKVHLETVTVTLQDVDTYGRLVGVVSLDGRNINLEMVAEGHAWWYEYYARGERELRRAQADAREAAIGLWAFGDPVPPWEWRRNR